MQLIDSMMCCEMLGLQAQSGPRAAWKRLLHVGSCAISQRGHDAKLQKIVNSFCDNKHKFIITRSAKVAAHAAHHRRQAPKKLRLATSTT